jgi:hypothetical protein
MSPGGFDRREFLKGALAIGGAGALSACVSIEGDPDTVPRGDPDSVPERQYEWNAHLPTGPHGNVKLPNHQLVFLLSYRGEGVPTTADRERVEAALRTIERAYPWGTSEEVNPTTTDGLLHFIGYAPQYFDRFDDDPSTGSMPMRPEAVIEELDEDAEPDAADAVLVLTSDQVSVLLSAEQALRGGFDTLNGVAVEAALTDVFDVVGRRTGFLGVGRPAEEFEEIDVPEHSPTAMGYRSGFKDNQATEQKVTIGIGPFAGGTMLQLSRLAFDLESWYGYDEPERVHRMFSPEHTPEQVGEIGEHLGGQSRISRETVDRTVEDAREHDLVGHTQKVASARDENFEPRILRRSEGVSTDLDRPAMNFISLQRFIGEFLDVRRAMNCPAHGGDFAQREAEGEEDGGGGDGQSAGGSGCPAHAQVPGENNGIDGFLEVLSRGTYLVPPRSLRALPTPNGEP